MILRKALSWIWRGLAILLIAIVVSWPLFSPDEKARGIWRTEGYGLVVDVGRFWVTGYQETAASCLPFFSAPAHSLVLSEAGDVTLGNEAERLTLSVEGTVNTIYADRIDALPPPCADGGTPTPPGTPPEIFEIAWSALNEHYPFFDLYGIDWQARHDALSPRVTDATTPPELWQLLTELLTGLDDGHVYLVNPESGAGFSPETAPDWQSEIVAFREVPRARDLTFIEDTGLEYTVLPGNIGYVFLRHMDTRPGLGTSPADVADRAFAEVAHSLADTRAIILDNRLNPGGTDTVALAYASYFTGQDVRAFSKVTRTADGYTPASDGWIRGRNPHLEQPVYLLNSSATASAAEIFSMAMQELEQVTIVGEPTSGALSDINEVVLPNGWLLGFSHQIYTDASGANLEGSGVPVDIFRPFDSGAFRLGQDPLMDEVLGMIGG